MKNTTIAAAGISDVACLLEIESSCFRNPWRIEHFTSAISSSSMDIYICRRNGAPAGYVVLSRLNKIMVIANLAVSPGHRRKGLGAMLLEFGLQYGRKNHCAYSILDVRQSNKAAINLYQKAGFLIIGSNREYYQNPCEDSFIMGRPA